MTAPAGLRLGIFDHFGWAVAVTASADGTVVDRRRIELVEPGVTPAPIHYDGKRLGVAGTTPLVAQVRESATRATTRAFDELTASLPEPVLSISLRSWPVDFPTDVADQLRVPYESRADAIMYRQILAEAAHARAWAIHLYAAKDVIALAAARLGAGADDVLEGPRHRLGPPWTKDHRIALSAAIIAG